MAQAWYHEFFTGVALDFWRAAVPPEHSDAEAAFLAEELKVAPPGRLLDVPCGDGRLAVRLAARGYEVTGLDISAENIATCRKATPPGARATWIEADMQGLPVEGPFDGAYCCGNSFGYLDYPAQQEFLSRVASALRPGARLVIDASIAADTLLPHFEQRAWYEAGGIYFLIENDYAFAESRLDTTCTFLWPGQKEVRRFSHFVYTVAEIRRMLAAAGLTTAALYAGLDRKPLDSAARMVIVVAQRGVNPPARNDRPASGQRKLADGTALAE
jgi:SAM-dependent methyltransferase